MDAIRKELTESFYAMPKETGILFYVGERAAARYADSSYGSFYGAFREEKREKPGGLLIWSIMHWKSFAGRMAQHQKRQNQCFQEPEADATIINTLWEPGSEHNDNQYLWEPGSKTAAEKP